MNLISALYNLKSNLKKRRSDYRYSQKLSEFESILAENPEIDDTEACFKLYGTKKLSQAYKSLKFRLEEKLINDVFDLCSIEEDTKSSVTAAIHLKKLSVVSQVLRKNFFEQESVVFIERLLSQSKKQNFAFIALDQLAILLNLHGFVEPNKVKFEKTIADLDYYLEMYMSELKLKKVYAQISHLYVMNKGGLNKKQLQIVKELVFDVKDFKEKYKSNFFISFVSDLMYFYYQNIGDYENALHVAQSTLDELSVMEIKDKLGMYQCKKNMAICHFFLQNYEESSLYFEEVIEVVTPGTRNWFNATSLYFLNLINSKSYPALIELSLKVLSNKNLEKHPYFYEQWKIREAYLHLLIKLKKIHLTNEQNKTLKPFSIHKFINSVYLPSKDKTGQNITIQVLQIMFLLLDNKYGKIMDKIESLTQYTYRYLNNDETFRSNCFIRMLVQMVKADFHPIRTKTYTESLKKKLDHSRLIIDERSAQVEILPYDFLWNNMMEILEMKKSLKN
ncbi:MAG: hypothetical protein R2774_00845 [Saprospiraceae bacterium]